MNKRPAVLPFVLAGWLAGVGATLLLGLFWPRILPSPVKPEQFYGTPLGLPIVYLTAMCIASPAALVGGLIGSRAPREGGRTDQLIFAALGGLLLSFPFGCLTLWYLTP